MELPRPLRLVAAVAAGVVAVVALGLLAVVTRQGGPQEPGVEHARQRAEVFLDRYVSPDGRVVRLDQGGDTVSEGQAYAMLLAIVAGDEDRFDRVWRWTQEHLQRPDGLLAWHWWDGEVVDEMSASDADLEAAWALLLAADQFDRPDLRAEALTIAEGVLAQSTAQAAGELVLTAGPWATDPVVLNPSYFVPAAFETLGAATGDTRWGDLDESSRRVLVEITGGGRRLPPDWAHVDGGGAVAPVGSPGGDGPGRYGLDAQRIPVRLATACVEEDRALAAELWQVLRGVEDDGARDSYGLTGAPEGEATNPLGLVAAAAAARAAGSEEASDLLARAERMAEAGPTYYGDAWAALGRALLTTALLDGCG